MFLSMLWILVSLAIGAASVDTDKYKKLGGDAVLSTSSVSDPITSITWKHGADIAVEWYGKETVAYRDFKGRCTLDFNTGALTISNLTVKDSGVYTAEINNRVMSPTEITVISAVPKPTVSTQCSSEETRCTFTCEANVTGAEPVTYYWMVDGKNITGSSKSLEKEKNDPEMVGKPISCQLKNPVSNGRSDDVIPFPNGDYTGAIVGGVAGILVLLIVVAVGLVIRCRRRRGSQNFNRDVSPCFACFSKRSSQSSEPSVRSQAYTPVQTEDGAEEEEPQISMSNGTVAYMKAGETHNQEQNSESTQSKHEPEPPERSEDDTPVQTEEGAEEVAQSSDSPLESRPDQTSAELRDSSSEPKPPERSEDDTPVQTEDGAEDMSEEETPEL